MYAKFNKHSLKKSNREKWAKNPRFLFKSSRIIEIKSISTYITMLTRLNVYLSIFLVDNSFMCRCTSLREIIYIQRKQNCIVDVNCSHEHFLKNEKEILNNTIMNRIEKNLRTIELHEYFWICK